MLRSKHWTEPRLWRKLKPVARAMRHVATQAEDALWDVLRNRRLRAARFRRQHPIGRFVVDFYCPEGRLAIELDGGIHDLRRAEDSAREVFLAQLGIRVIRFRNEDVLARTGWVLAEIARAVHQVTGRPGRRPHPVGPPGRRPSPPGGEGGRERSERPGEDEIGIGRAPVVFTPSALRAADPLHLVQRVDASTASGRVRTRSGEDVAG